MSLDVIRAAIHTEADDELHIARLLVLLRALGGNSRKPVDGIMKLAKLDFLLRYPTYLERALLSAEQDPLLAQVQAHERTSIESKMVRFRYGPWDGRYRRWIALLYARGLATTQVKGQTIYAELTEAGARVADALAVQSSASDQATRAVVLKNAFGGYSGTKLKEFIYATFPEITSMKWGQEIRP